MRGQRNGGLRLIVPADAAGLTDLLSAVRATLATWAVPDAATHDILVMADELATNIIRHAWNSEPGHRFSFALTLEQVGRRPQLVMHFCDDGTAFDPTRFRPVGLDAELDQRGPGGVGLALVQGLAQEFTYRRKNGENRIRVCRVL